ncbi:hypothetical protein SS50377_24529 [Spironucleus salmonicida]|uniref:Uncharacterized protein n=1 Tax=Spironucleus salmonicida TaxID=348837 RepID=V6LNV9_9EUKA|nr:hypothetical protein SS50377_24529 [Spironucleus salmonicida]|eukprot:EST45928.1 hypothetical protein SS50377_13906 [Spironucleus salmonicida]
MFVILQYHIKVTEELFINKNELNLATRPYLEGIRLQTGVDIVIISQNRFRHSVEAGKVDDKKLNKILLSNDSINIFQVALTGAQVHPLLQYLIQSSSCDRQRDLFPELHGVQLDLNNATCAVSGVRVCTWFVSESYLCKRWQVLTDTDIVRVIIDSYLINDTRVQEILTGTPLSSKSIDLVKSVKYFLFSYTGDLLENDISGQQTNESSLNSFVVVSCLIIVMAIGINIFFIYSRYELQSPENDSYVGQQMQETEEEAKFKKLGRKEVLEQLAGNNE